MLRPIAAVVAALLLGLPAAAQEAEEDDIAPLAERFSVAVPDFFPPLEPDRPTLLDPSWLLPPIESLDLANTGDGAEAGLHLLHDSAAAAPQPLPTPRPAGPFAYAVSDRLTTQLRYRHSLAFDLSGSKLLRDDPATAYSTDFNRDVVDLNMSWRLAGNTVGVGYQLQSTRAANPNESVGIGRFLPGSEQATHSLTFGLSRQWGASVPPPLIEPPLLPPELDIAGAETTPTPAP